METWLAHGGPSLAPELFTPRLAPAPVASARNPFGALIAFGQAPKPPTPPPAAAPQAPKPAAAAPEPLDLAAALSSPRLASASAASPYGVLLDPGFLQTDKPAPLSAPPAMEAKLEAAPASPEIPVLSETPAPAKPEVAAIEAPPLPPARPAALAPAAQPQRRVAPQGANQSVVATAPAPDDRNIFEKLFGMGRQQPGAVVAYAEPEGQAANPARGSSLAGTDRSSGFSFFGKSSPTTGYDQYTAVYDISARTVYLPDGRRLEAHSGLGDRLDDPRFVSERNRGATPPHLYDLTLREQLFHGVQAIRLTPVGEGGVYGRAGLLAHTFMLGPNGDSNGCVSFKDYDAFLRAFEQGEIKRLAVVAKL
ncbi:MAG TPA: DUF2778 domain-containing protein [Roseiarcus sp.]